MSTGSLNGGIIGADNTPSPTKKITTFTSNGCFNRTATTAGGGSAGVGGAGGVYVTGTDHPLPSDAVPVTVGAGGAAAAANGPLGAHGNNSVFGSASDPVTAKKEWVVEAKLVVVVQLLVYMTLVMLLAQVLALDMHQTIVVGVVHTQAHLVDVTLYIKEALAAVQEIVLVAAVVLVIQDKDMVTQVQRVEVMVVQVET